MTAVETWLKRRIPNDWFIVDLRRALQRVEAVPARDPLKDEGAAAGPKH